MPLCRTESSIGRLRAMNTLLGFGWLALDRDDKPVRGYGGRITMYTEPTSELRATVAAASGNLCHPAPWRLAAVQLTIVNDADSPRATG